MSRCGVSAHCCYIAGAVCPYLTTSPHERFQFACLLRWREGSWAGAYESVEYRGIVRPALRAAGVEQDCGDWPEPGNRCGACGEEG